MRQRLALVAATFDQIIGEVEVADLDRIRIAIDVLEAERRFCKRSSLCRVAPVVFKSARAPRTFPIISIEFSCSNIAWHPSSKACASSSQFNRNKGP